MLYVYECGVIACMFNNEGIILSLFKVMKKHIFSHRNSTWRRYSFTLNDNISRKYHWIQWCGIVKHLWICSMWHLRVLTTSKIMHIICSISLLKCLGKRKENYNKIKFQKKLRQNFYFSLVLSAGVCMYVVQSQDSDTRWKYFFSMCFFFSLCLLLISKLYLTPCSPIDCVCTHHFTQILW